MVGTCSKVVTVTCANHHKVLVDGLWNLFLTKRHTDLNIDAGGQVIMIHQLLVEIFLSVDKLIEYVLYTSGHHLDYIFQFLYKGTIVVAKSERDDLLAVARELQFIILMDAIESSSIDARSNMVNITGSNHYATLVRELWRMYQNKERTDLNIQGCKQKLCVHQFLVAVFLSTDKLIDYVLFTRAVNLSTILEFLYRGTVKARRDRLKVLQDQAKELYFWILDDAIDLAQDDLKKCLVSQDFIDSRIGLKVPGPHRMAAKKTARARSKPGRSEKQAVKSSKRFFDSNKVCGGDSCTSDQSNTSKSKRSKRRPLKRTVQLRSQTADPLKRNFTRLSSKRPISVNVVGNNSAVVDESSKCNHVSKRLRGTTKLASPIKENFKSDVPMKLKSVDSVKEHSFGSCVVSSDESPIHTESMRREEDVIGLGVSNSVLMCCHVVLTRVHLTVGGIWAPKIAVSDPESESVESLLKSCALTAKVNGRSTCTESNVGNPKRPASSNRPETAKIRPKEDQVNELGNLESNSEYQNNGHDSVEYSAPSDNSATIFILNSEGNKVKRTTKAKIQSICTRKVGNLSKHHKPRRLRHILWKEHAVTISEAVQKRKIESEDLRPYVDSNDSYCLDKSNSKTSERISLGRTVKLEGSAARSKYVGPVDDDSVSENSSSTINPSSDEESSASAVQLKCSIYPPRGDSANQIITKSKYRRPFKWHHCKVCKKKFTHSGYLTVHLRIHTNTNPYKCTVCQKSFSRRHTLTVHERTHSGARPYECTASKCQMTFTTRSDLKRHSLVHSGLKLHKCKICKKKFALRFGLTAHLLTH